MTLQTRFIRRWIKPALIGSVVMLGQSIGRGQTPTVAIAPTPEASRLLDTATPKTSLVSSQDASEIAPGESAPSTERTWSGPQEKAERAKTFWERVPPITPYPRPGNFIIAPNGPGYYTIWDYVRNRELPDRPKDPYLQWGQNPNPFFNADFRFLDDPNNTQTDIFDPIKRIHLGEDWLLSTGGEVRDRYNNLDNANAFNKKPQAGTTDTYNLFRARVYGDAWYKDYVRVFGEFITADASTQTIPPASSDINKFDILNLFVDVKLWTINENGLYVRGGRQELLFGSQRLISPSDWSNSIRTFQGVRAFYHGEKLEADTFWVQPLIVNTGRVDNVDSKQDFVGEWLKYRINKDISIDAYYLYLENANLTASGRGGVLGGFDLNTFGGRFIGQAGSAGQFLWDFEGAYQFGAYSNQVDRANMYVTGLGYYFHNVQTTPTFWVYYDHASGNATPNVGNEHNTFNPLFPFGHHYFDSLDIIGRYNINDFHLEFACFPTDFMRITAGYHHLNLDQAKDALYNPTGSVVRQDKTGKDGTDVGNAINAGVQFHIDNHQVVLISYSHLFAGTFMQKTAVDAAAAKDVSALWVQYTFKW